MTWSNLFLERRGSIGWHLGMSRVHILEGEPSSTAADRHESLLNKRERIDPEEARILREATDNEVSLGFLEGSFDDRNRREIFVSYSRF